MKGVGFLFDLDGVLIDSERRYTRIWADIERDFPTGVPDFPRAIKGMTLNNIIARYFPAPDTGREVARRCLEAESRLTFGYMPGARELLARLRGVGVPVALVTSSDDRKMLLLRRLLPGFVESFDAVVDGSMVTEGKPHPEPYLTGARLLGVPPGRCAVVEDAVNGLKSGLAAGAYVIGMTDTLGLAAVEPHAMETHDSLEEIDPEAVIKILEKR